MIGEREMLQKPPMVRRGIGFSDSRMICALMFADATDPEYLLFEHDA